MLTPACVAAEFGVMPRAWQALLIRCPNRDPVEDSEADPDEDSALGPDLERDTDRVFGPDPDPDVELPILRTIDGS